MQMMLISYILHTKSSTEVLCKISELKASKKQSHIQLLLSQCFNLFYGSLTFKYIIFMVASLFLLDLDSGILLCGSFLKNSLLYYFINPCLQSIMVTFTTGVGAGTWHIFVFFIPFSPSLYLLACLPFTKDLSLCFIFIIYLLFCSSICLNFGSLIEKKPYDT